MGTLNYNTLRPFSSTPKGLPRLIQPYEELNGKIEGNRFQYQPSDSPDLWHNGGNLEDYAEDEMLYTANRQGFRGNSIENAQRILMTAGCSHTYGIGVRSHEVWGHILSEHLDLYHINIGVGGIGCDTTALLIKQFFEEGVIPDTLVVLWPAWNRKMLVTDKAKKLDDQIHDFILDPKVKFDPFIFQFAATGNWSNGAMSAGPHNQKELNAAVKGHLLQSTQHNLFDFWFRRELVIELCANYNVKLIEAFLEPETMDYVKQNCNRKIPRLELHTKGTKDDFGVDLARDGMHFGAKSHSNIANKLYDIIKTQ